MDSEDFQRHMDFVIKQQAKFDEEVKRLEEMIRENREDIVKLVGVSMNLTIQIAELIEHGKETDRRIAELAVSGKETDARLNSLISVVEGHISDGHKH